MRTSEYGNGVELTKDEVTKIISYLEDHHDEGPPDEGWQSSELVNLITELKQMLALE